ncbi:MAG: UvrD-helicase domain-containing protein [Chloroflexota bacterium]
MDLTPEQTAVARLPLDSKTLLAGRAGAGKTTAAAARLRFLLDRGVRADSILLLTPQRTLHEPYLDSLLRDPYAGTEITPATVGGLARRMVELYWPLAAEAAGFAHPDRAPIFLTLETAQYYMAHLVRPLLDKGYFESVTIDRNRLYSQILDNLNKSAAVGFDYREIGERLTAAWTGDTAQRRVYADAQDCATRFRTFCLQNNLLDFSLQLEIFWNILWRDASVRSHLTRTYRHLIYDNVEEDIPVAHDLIADWFGEFDSALVIYDEGGGYRQFLGADPRSAQRFEELCNERIVFEDSFVMSGSVAEVERALSSIITGEPMLQDATGNLESVHVVLREDSDRETPHFYPELLDSITKQVQHLIGEEGIPPAEIAILAPYLSDALRFSLMNRLETAGIPVRSHRPSRSLRDEPASRALLTLAALAHPQWEIHPPRPDAAYALMLALDTDLVRAQLLTEIVYRQKDLRLSPFDEIHGEMQERITYIIGNKYALLRQWLISYRDSEPIPLDHFLRKLFGEVLSQPGFGFHHDFDFARVAASLIESVKKFRQALEPTMAEGGTAIRFDELGREYFAMLQDGVIAAQYLQPYRQKEGAVLVAPAYTFLMMNRPVTAQFWLDVGSSSWVERPSQPLTQPYVLSRNWPAGRLWTDADEVASQTDILSHLVSGLLHRCRERVYLGFADLGESGFEQRGVLLRTFQKVLQTG